MRIAAVDYGLKRIGLAISDPRGTIALPLKTVGSFNEAVTALRPYLPLKRLVVGLPLTLKGERGEMAQRAEAFADKLSQTLQVPVHFIDERLSSKQVERDLAHLSRHKRTPHADSAAATLLLQTYLQQLENAP